MIMVRMNARTPVVRSAKNAIDAAVTAVADERGLTYTELLGCLVEVQAGVLKDALREERHPGREDALGADEACNSACAHAVAAS